MCFVRIGYIIVEKFGSNYYIARKFWRKKKRKEIIKNNNLFVKMKERKKNEKVKMVISMK